MLQETPMKLADVHGVLHISRLGLRAGGEAGGREGNDFSHDFVRTLPMRCVRV